MKSIIISSFLMIAMICLPIILSAQDEEVLPVEISAPGDPNGDPDEVPIDGGLSILIAAGAGYVIKKGYNRKNLRVTE